MAELKEPAHHNLWYGSPVQMSAGRSSQPVDSVLSNPSTASPHAPGRPRGGQPAWGVEQHQYPYGRYSQDDSDPYDRHQQQHPSLTAHHSFPNLKRPYAGQEQPPYQEIVQDLRDDGSKLGVNHDHKLLSFKRVQDKHTIVDAHGRIQQLEMSAQLHGMFFLSEMPQSASDGTILQPELTCYRRNLFQISGSLITPRGQLSVITETGETVPVSSTEVTISATESVDGHAVRLIVIPWKTPPPNSPEINQAPDQEPQSLPLIPFQDDGTDSAEGEYAVYPIGWRRLQFRIATANNGRRKELQQHFILHLRVVGTLANGTKVILTESGTAPIVVRGRSPRNFQARKEIPLLGSSAGSRGQSLVETGLGIVAGPLTLKPQEAKARSLNMELPRSAFTFTAGPKMPASPMSMRSNSYPAAWNQPMSHIPSSGPANYPATTMASDQYQKIPLSGGQGFTAEPQEMPQQLQTSMPSVQLSLVSADQQPTGQGQHSQHSQQAQAPPSLRSQYAAYGAASAPPPQLPLSSTAGSTSLAVPRYVDESNPRPAKSPRNGGHQSVHSSSSIANTDSSAEYRYGPSPYGAVNPSDNINAQVPQPPLPPPPAYGTQGTQDTSNPGAGPPSAPGPGAQQQQAPPRDYFPPAASWTTTAGEQSVSAYSSGAPGDGRPYGYQDQYKPGGHVGMKDEQQAQGQQPPAPVYPSQRGSFDAMNQYSWNGT